jgi:hypothetical protein
MIQPIRGGEVNVLVKKQGARVVAVSRIQDFRIVRARFL